ncbi:uncharacterized protein LOC142574735 [Dermacentor variabilis]|uniref:uncharacterized protein LOC142574735 n=1 Tax=Dermacentor variabilis TaxID=34621 RepID=UPI003F5B1FB1
MVASCHLRLDVPPTLMAALGCARKASVLAGEPEAPTDARQRRPEPPGDRPELQLGRWGRGVALYAETSGEGVDTLAPFYVETKNTPDIKRPPEEHELWSSPALVNRSLTPARIVPTPPTSRGGVCTTFDCRYAAQWLRSKLDYSVDPCKDFYKFVCGSFRGFDEFVHVARGIEVTTKAFLGNLRVPSSNQNSQQKAAGMYQACVAFAWSGRKETTSLVEWMISLNLDLMNKTRLAAVNPVEMMVRASLDLGVKAVIAIVLRNQDFLAGKRVIQIEYSKEQEEWMIQRPSESDNFDYYVRHLQRYGVNAPEDTQLALKIIGYEREQVRHFLEL